MTRALSLHLGLNRVDPRLYAGWSGPLTACEFDATDMEHLAAAAGFETRKLLTASATRSALRTALTIAADRLVDGDIFLWTASCHGGQIPDLDGDESDALDETLCLFDGQWLDDETARMFDRFRSGVRIVTVLDACHTGTPDRARGVRGMPHAVAVAAYEQNRSFYDTLMSELTRGTGPQFSAASLTLGACLDDQTAADGETNGRFTEALKGVWNSGAFIGDYVDFHDAIRRRMPPTQTPTLQTEGPFSSQLSKQHPFSIERVNAMVQKSKNTPRGWSDDADEHAGIEWGRSQPGTATPARASHEVTTLLEGDYATSRLSPSTLYAIRDGQREAVPPPDAVAVGVTQADVKQVDPLLLAAYPVRAARGRDQTFHLWTDLHANHSMESWAWFSPGKVSVRTVTKTATWFGGFTGGVRALLVGPNGEIIPEVDIHAAYGVDGTAFGSGLRDETVEWEIPQATLERADTIAFVHGWEPKVDEVAEILKWVKIIWDLYRTLEGQDSVGFGSDVSG